jgi:hypothetical protein
MQDERGDVLIIDPPYKNILGVFLEKPVDTGFLAAFLLKRPKTRSFPVNYSLAGNWVSETGFTCVES